MSDSIFNFVQNFKLDTQLQSDTHLVINDQYYQLLLHKTSLVPWYILVPKTQQTELFDCEGIFAEYILEAVGKYARKLSKETKADKINVATIGNVVKQCHIHIIARFCDDFAWPNAVWGRAEIAQSKCREGTDLDKLLHLFD